MLQFEKKLDRKAVQKISWKSNCQIELKHCKKQLQKLTSGLETFCCYSACQMERLMRVKQPSSQGRWSQKRSRGLDVKQRSSSFKSGFFQPTFHALLMSQIKNISQISLLVYSFGQGQREGNQRGHSQLKQLVEKGQSANCRQLFAVKPVQPGKQSTYLECQKQLFWLFLLGGVYCCLAGCIEKCVPARL